MNCSNIKLPILPRILGPLGPGKWNVMNCDELPRYCYASTTSMLTECTGLSFACDVLMWCSHVFTCSPVFPMETDPVATSSPGRSGSDKSYVATGGVAQKQGRGFPAIQPRKNGKAIWRKNEDHNIYIISYLYLYNIIYLHIVYIIYQQLSIAIYIQ